MGGGAEARVGRGAHRLGAQHDSHAVTLQLRRAPALAVRGEWPGHRHAPTPSYPHSHRPATQSGPLPDTIPPCVTSHKHTVGSCRSVTTCKKGRRDCLGRHIERSLRAAHYALGAAQRAPRVAQHTLRRYIAPCGRHIAPKRAVSRYAFRAAFQGRLRCPKSKNGTSVHVTPSASHPAVNMGRHGRYVQVAPLTSPRAGPQLSRPRALCCSPGYMAQAATTSHRASTQSDEVAYHAPRRLEPRL